MMYRKKPIAWCLRSRCWPWPGFWVAAWAGGDLPSSVTIELPDGTSVKADDSSGAASLANSSWRFYRTAENLQPRRS